MKRIILLIILIFVLAGCSPSEEFSIKKNKNYINLKVDEKYKIANIIDAKAVNWISSDEDVVIIEDEYVIALSVGQSIVSASIDDYTIIYIFNVYVEINNISISGKSSLDIGEVSKFTATVYPEELSQEVVWDSSDKNVLDVDVEGNVTGVSFGFARIIATSKIDKSIVSEFHVAVTEISDLANFEDLINKLENNIDSINVDDYRFLDPLVRNSIGSIVGVSSFSSPNILEYSSGIIYKREAHLKDGTVIQGNEFLHHLKEINFYKYYVLSNEFIFQNASEAKIFYGEEYLDANVIAKDPKSDLSVLTFESKLYFPTAIFSNEEIAKGEIIMAIGHPEGYDYYQSVSMGIVSNLERYISYDTDNDTVDDWGMMFIQHDAAISNGNYGGPLINLKGEVIAVNARKVISWSIEGMNFAIPIDEVQKIIAILETGEIPQRVVLGVNGYNVEDIYNNPDNSSYIGIELYGATNGFYVLEVSEGLAENVIIEKDIIISYNNVEIKHISDLRNEINRFLLGSGDTVSIEVIRNGVIKKLFVVY